MNSSMRIRGRRKGSVLLEAALLMPVLLLVIFGMIELGHLIFTQHTLTGAARNGVRTAIVAGSTNEDVQNSVGQIMSASGYSIDDYSLSIEDLAGNSVDVSTAERDDEILVRVSATWGTVGIRPLGIVDENRTLQGIVVMRKEGS